MHTLKFFTKYFFLLLWSLCLRLPLLAQDNLSLATAYLGDGELDRAKNNIDQVFQKAGAQNNSEAWFYKAEIYKQIVLDGMLDQPQYTQLNSDELVYQVYEAYEQAMKTDPKKEAFYNEAAAANVSVPDIMLNFGVISYQKGMETEDQTLKNSFLDKSIRAFRFIQKLKPEYTTAYLYAVVAAQERKNYPVYEQSMEKVLSMSLLKTAKHHANYSFYHRDIKKDTLTALKICEAGLAKAKKEFDPKYYETLEKLQIEYLVTLKKTEEAVEALEKGIQREARNMDYHLKLGELYEVQAQQDSSRIEKAIEIYQKAVAIERNNHKANYNAGALLFNTRSIPALQEYNQLSRKNQNEYREELKNEVEIALPYLEKANRLKAQDYFNLMALRTTYQALEREEDVLEIDEVLLSLEAESGL